MKQELYKTAGSTAVVMKHAFIGHQICEPPAPQDTDCQQQMCKMTPEPLA